MAGIGNMWMAEALWSVRTSPWQRVRDVEDGVLRDALAAARRLMREALATGRPGRQVYRRAGRPCRRCGTLVRSRGPGRREPHRLLVPRLSGRRRAAGE